MTVLANGLVIGGVCILIGSLVPVQRLIARLPAGRVRRDWQVLRALIVVFIAGYLLYAVAEWNRRGTLLDLVVPVIFLLGACFVFLVNTLSLQTALDVRRVADLEVESITDPLLGIHNRRYLDRRLREEVARALRYDLPLSVLLLDIDHFKRVNDQHGHLVGDLVLKGLAQVVVKTARNTDVVARYGGEEILVITTNTPPAAASVLAERLRRAVEDSVLVPPTEHSGGVAVGVTVSIGVASLGQATSDADTLMRLADDALYRAKGEGRNRVVVHGAHAVT